MLSIENLEKFTKQSQTSIVNVVREYCQHLFLSYLYKQSGSEKLLFKGGTALRIVFGSPRYSEDLDFTGLNTDRNEIEEIFTNTLMDIENTGMKVDIDEAKNTTGGYLGVAIFNAYGMKINIQIEVSLRESAGAKGIRTLIDNEYIPAYTLVHLSTEGIIEGKLQALRARKKPRDFYDYFFLLSGNYPIVKEKNYLLSVLKELDGTKIDFKGELNKFLPVSHAPYLKDFKKTLSDKINMYIG